ncbi:MarR family winged helix-turn-helix transcriptional regulator [Niallia nealsonii]|uniref:MarR family transcriptional regulator n=1 Tax=Niallia nealsonii TaxID=115979 RepID=A0A2N0YZF6_9BACI|nr:MarR family transcriptional regulator [Niallia nealsonii]PKG22641.1 MarR family transcriptional regulator [Niallia nealsonii]
MKDTENVIQTNAKYHELDAKANIIYKFVMNYNDYIKTARDYGTGEIINMVEVHTLTVIEENPGTTVTEVALEWNRTRGAVSQIITKLEQRGLIIRKKKAGNAKNVHLYVTDKGEILSKAHKEYDIKELTWADKTLHKRFTTEEINLFYNVMQKYTELLEIPNNE